MQDNQWWCGWIQGGCLLCEFTHGNEMGLGRGIYLLIYQMRGITSVAYYFLFSQCPPLPSPQQAALVNVCWQQRLPWAGCRTWGLYVFIYPSICRCQGKGKVIFCVWPTGETEANDLGHVDCYLAPRIALYFYERGPGNASRSIGWGVSTAEVEVGGGMCWGRRLDFLLHSGGELWTQAQTEVSCVVWLNCACVSTY